MSLIVLDYRKLESRPENIPIEFDNTYDPLDPQTGAGPPPNMKSTR